MHFDYCGSLWEFSESEQEDTVTKSTVEGLTPTRQ